MASVTVVFISIIAALVVILSFMGRGQSRKTQLIKHDLLTGLYNREGFITAAGKILKGSQPDEFAILFFNIKGFKAINELFGTNGGDEVLQQSADLIVHSKLHPLVTARFEADHFVCLVRSQNIDCDMLVRLCQRVYISGEKKFNFYGRCGIYIIDDPSASVSGMCDRAKLAKDFIKDDFAQPYAFYDTSMRDGFVTNKELTSELKRALEDREFEVYYQPVYEFKTGRIESAEALVRWNHPHRGLLSPGEFIPIFEENGYISELDDFVRREARNLVRDRVIADKHAVPVAANMSRMDFYDAKLIRNFYSILDDFSLPADLVRIELTESAYVALAENGIDVLRHLKTQGISILLDDFGSGYSSFSSVRDFDFDIIKLDMGFVQQIETNPKVAWIIHSIIDMAHHLGIRVIAEGVETQEEADVLIGADCDLAQGYLYSKPVPRAEFEKMLDSDGAKQIVL